MTRWHTLEALFVSYLPAFLPSCCCSCCCFVFLNFFTHFSFGRVSFNDFSFLEVEEESPWCQNAWVGITVLLPKSYLKVPKSTNLNKLLNLCLDNPQPTETVLHIVHAWQIFIALMYICVYVYINIKILIHLFLISFIKLSKKWWCCYCLTGCKWHFLKSFQTMKAVRIYKALLIYVWDEIYNTLHTNHVQTKK